MFARGTFSHLAFKDFLSKMSHDHVRKLINETGDLDLGLFHSNSVIMTQVI